MKICVFGVPGIPLGKHNVRDPRLDWVDKLVEAKKKTYAQVDVAGEDTTLEADAILVLRERFPDLILHDLEFVETRLDRNPPDAERSVLKKLRAELENEQTMYKAGLSKEELLAVAAHSFHTHKPVVIAANADLENPDALIVRTFQESGYICFLTVGGKENRAWPVRKGATAREAAGTIHTDMQKGFIRAEIIGFADFLAAGGETQAKRAGKQRLETKDYVMQDYDLVNFRFNK
jgi:ribosome-binding ATPase YchF (GTP1/OBG family)